MTIETLRAKYRNATVATIHYALLDLKETMDIWKGEPADHPYNVKLHAEWDFLLGLKMRGTV